MNVAWLYEHLGVALGHPRGDEAPVRCFAALDEHRREDRRPSASVNLLTGAWFCHGCGRGGGAYDAALAVGRTPRQAMDLLRAGGLPDRGAQPDRRTGPATSVRRAIPSPAVRLDVSERQLAAWTRALATRPVGAVRILAARGLGLEVLLGLGVGWDGRRFTLPIRDADGQIEGLVRYTPWPSAGAPKALAVRGSRRDLFPAPETMAGRELVLCEGEPDALALLSRGIAAFAIPGVGAWRRADPARLTGRSVHVVFDCDAPGRAAATLVTDRLRAVGIEAHPIDLAPWREDGYDITDALHARDPALRRAAAGR